jgi:hypothetical protein
VYITDFNQGWIKALTCTSEYVSCSSAQPLDYQAGPTVSLAQGPDGNIYQLTLTGELSRIESA